MKPSIVFLGTGPVALASLTSLHENFTIELVITKTKPIHHKGDPEVLRWCRDNTIAAIEVNDKQDLEQKILTKDMQSQVGVVVDFGIIISQNVIDSFKHGILNSHFSLLPLLRGADPITYTILEGHSETGVSLMQIVEKLDEGPLLAQRKLSIDPHETTPSLTKKLISLSNDILTECIPQFLAGDISPMPQSSAIAPTYSKQFKKSDGELDFTLDANILECQVRAFAGWPSSFTTLHSKRLTVTEAILIPKSGDPGAFFIHDKELAVYCKSDALVLRRVKPEGKKEMTSHDYLLGHPLDV